MSRRRRKRAQSDSPGLEPASSETTVTTTAAPLPKPGRDWLILCAILLAALLLRLYYWSELVKKPDFDSPTSDAQYNDYWARGLTTGDWTPPEDSPNPDIPGAPFFRPPGYPYFVALIYSLTGGSYYGPRVVQTLLGLAAIVLVFLLGRALFGRTVGLIAAGMSGVYWGLIYFEGELLEPSLLVVLTLGLLVLLHVWSVKRILPFALLSGAALGLFAVVRSNVLLFAPIMALWMVWVLYRRGELRRAVTAIPLVVAGSLIPILPVTIRNYTVGNELVLISTNGGINLYIGNNEHASLVTPRVPDIERLAGRSGWSLFSYEDIVRGVQREQGRPMTYTEVSRYFSGRAFDFIRSEPGKAIGYAFRRAALFWGPREISNEKVVHYERRQSAVLRFLPGFPLAASAFVVGVILWIAHVRGARWLPGDRDSKTDSSFETVVLILLFIAVYSGSFVPFLMAARFRVSLVPLLLLLAAFAVHQLWEMVQSRRALAAGLSGLAWLVLLAVFSISWVEYEPDVGTWHLDRATAYSQKGELDPAIASCRAAIQANPDYPENYALLASLMARKGAMNEAVEAYRQAVQRAPSSGEMHHKLGLLLDELGRLDEAIFEFKAALAVAPNNVDAWYNLGRSLQRKGQVGESLAAYRKALDIDPNMAEAWVNMAVLLRSQGNNAESTAALRKAIGIKPDLVEAHFNLAINLHSANDIEGCIKELETCLRLRPDHQEARQALQQLRTSRTP